MKYIILTTIAALSVSASYATDTTKKIDVINYQVEDTSIFEISGHIPGSDIAFYSEKGGGSLIGQVKTNSDSIFVYKNDTTFKPAFVLNTNTINTDSIKGTGMTGIVPEPEFSMFNYKIDDNNGVTTLTWQAYVDNHDADFSFEISGSDDAENYSLVSPAVYVEKGALMQYKFTDDKYKFKHYKIKLLQNTKSRYTTDMLTNQYLNLSVYPTIANDVVNIIVNVPRDYTLINSVGQLVKTGILIEGQNKIDVSNLPNGTYFVHLIGVQNNQNVKFIKL